MARERPPVVVTKEADDLDTKALKLHFAFAKLNGGVKDKKIDPDMYQQFVRELTTGGTPLLFMKGHGVHLQAPNIKDVLAGIDIEKFVAALKSSSLDPGCVNEALDALAKASPNSVVDVVETKRLNTEQPFANKNRW